MWSCSRIWGRRRPTRVPRWISSLWIISFPGRPAKGRSRRFRKRRRKNNAFADFFTMVTDWSGGGPRHCPRSGAFAWRCLEMPCRQSTFHTLLALAAVAGASAASAQRAITSNETFKTMIGKWEISTAERDRSCHLTFKADPSGALFKLDVDRACGAQMPELKEVTGWTIGGLDLVRLMDGKGKPVLEFSEVESGIFEAQRPGEGIFFMPNAASPAAVNVPPDQMPGHRVVGGSS